MDIKYLYQLAYRKLFRRYKKVLGDKWKEGEINNRTFKEALIQERRAIDENPDGYIKRGRYEVENKITEPIEKEPQRFQRKRVKHVYVNVPNAELRRQIEFPEGKPKGFTWKLPSEIEEEKQYAEKRLKREIQEGLQPFENYGRTCPRCKSNPCRC